MASRLASATPIFGIRHVRREVRLLSALSARRDVRRDAAGRGLCRSAVCVLNPARENGVLDARRNETRSNQPDGRLCITTKGANAAAGAKIAGGNSIKPGPRERLSSMSTGLGSSLFRSSAATRMRIGRSQAAVPPAALSRTNRYANRSNNKPCCCGAMSDCDGRDEVYQQYGQNYSSVKPFSFEK
jgi:hypothetical protein